MTYKRLNGKSQLINRAVCIVSFMLCIFVFPATVCAQQDGMNCLFMGHSFFAPVMDHLPTHTDHAQIDSHQQRVVFRAGFAGSPANLWSNVRDENVLDAKAWIQTGEVDLIGLTAFSTGSEFADYAQWVDFAREYNPHTLFFIQAPWPTYNSSTFTQYEASAAQTVALIHLRIDQLRDAYPDNRFICIPQSRWMTELWRLFDQNLLPELTEFVAADPSQTQNALFADNFGHAGELALREGALLWLSAIYNIDLRNYQYDTGTQADLKSLAHDLLHEDLIYSGVNLLDLSLFSAAWLSIPTDQTWNQACDLVSDSVIDVEDLIFLCEFWLQ
jgi:hypothetical protein